MLFGSHFRRKLAWSGCYPVPRLFLCLNFGQLSCLYRYCCCVEHVGDLGSMRRCAGGDGPDSGDWGVGIMGNVPRSTWRETRKTFRSYLWVLSQCGVKASSVLLGYGGT